MSLLQFRSKSHRRRIMGGLTTYQQQVLALNPIAYWPLSDTAGSVARCLVNSAQNGAYTGVTLANAAGPDGISQAPLFDGTNDYVNVFNAAVRDAIDLDEGTASIWIKVFNVGVWSDSAFRRVLYIQDNSPLNTIDMMRYNINDRFYFERRDDTGSKSYNYTTAAPTAWTHAAITWSVTGNATKYYWAGSHLAGQDDAADAATGTIVTALLGASSVVPAYPWYGWLADAALFSSPLSAANIATLATV